MTDLFCLVADRNMEAVFSELLRRPESLGIHQITYEIRVHPRRDPGCFHEGVSFVKELRDTYEHFLIILDRAWEGAPADSGEAIEALLDDDLRQAKLGDRAKAVVIDPELEVWVFGPSRRVEEVLGWPNQPESLRAWLESRGLWPQEAAKPHDPKEALERTLRRLKRPRSSLIYRDLARKVGIGGCTDPAFGRLKDALQGWFRSTPFGAPRDRKILGDGI